MMRTILFLLAPLLSAPVLSAAEWTDSAAVKMGVETCVEYQAKIEGGYLTVRATHFGDWHTYAMDNELRAAEKLAGKMSLGIDAPTQIAVTGGAKTAGGWLQSEPVDLSRPEIRWYTFGFEAPALFVTKIERAGGGPAEIAVRGQACTATQCKNIELTLSVPVVEGGSRPDLDSLVEVRVR